MARVIINADDLGIHPDIDRGISKAHADGILTSATALMTTPFSEDAIKAISIPQQLPTGIHLSLTLGWAVSDPAAIPNLVDAQGAFNLRARDLITMRMDNSFKKQIATELRAQIERFISFGLHPTHMDSHQHVHLNPDIFSIIGILGDEFSIPSMRKGYEPLWPQTLFHRPQESFLRLNIIKWALARWQLRTCSNNLKSTDRFFGFLHSGTLDQKLMQQLLKRVDREQTWEIACHPGYPAILGEHKIYPQREVDAFISSPARAMELEAVTASNVIHTAKNSAHKFINFSDI